MNKTRDNIVKFSISDILGRDNTNAKKCGLWTGKTGQALIYFILARYTGKALYHNKASGLLEEIAEDINQLHDTSFSEGICGIGWALEWLQQHDFLDINTDEVLESIDDVMYKHICYTRQYNISLQNGMLGQMAYLNMRRHSINPQSSRYIQLVQEECMIILINQISELLPELISNPWLAPDHKTIIEIGNLMIFLSEFVKFNINLNTISSLLFDCVKFSGKLLSDMIDTEPVKSRIMTLRYLSACLQITGEQYCCREWEKQGLDFLYKISPYYYPDVSLPSTKKFQQLLADKITNQWKTTIQVDVLPFTLHNGVGKLLLNYLTREKDWPAPYRQLMYYI